MKLDPLQVLAVTMLILYSDAAIGQGRERELAVTLAESQWNAIGKCLSKEPFGEVVGVMGELQRQTGSQIAAAASETAKLRAEVEQLRAENAKLKEGKAP